MVSSSTKAFIGNRTIVLPHIDSTNKFAYELFSKSNPIEGTVVFTYFQTQGKGQIGRSWLSIPNNNLALSIILRPAFLEVKQQFLLNLCLSVAVAEFIEDLTNHPIFIKWPNDIYFQNKKLAGLLIQNLLVSQRISYSVLGVGINVNQDTFSKKLPNPVSLKQISRQSYHLLDLKDQFCPYLEKYYRQIRDREISDLKEKYMSRLFLRNVPANFKLPDGKIFKGIIRNISQRGTLVMEIDGREQVFQMNEFQYQL